MLKISKEPISLETPVGEEDDSHLRDFNRRQTTLSPLDSAIHDDMRKNIDLALSSLSPKERDIIKKRFGIGDEVPHTLEDVGNEFESRGNASGRSRSRRSGSCGTPHGANGSGPLSKVNSAWETRHQRCSRWYSARRKP